MTLGLEPDILRAMTTPNPHRIRIANPQTDAHWAADVTDPGAARQAWLDITDLDFATLRAYSRWLAMDRPPMDPKVQAEDLDGREHARRYMEAPRVVCVGWDGRSQPMLRYVEDMGLADHLQRIVAPEHRG